MRRYVGTVPYCLDLRQSSNLYSHLREDTILGSYDRIGIILPPDPHPGRTDPGPHPGPTYVPVSLSIVLYVNSSFYVNSERKNNLYKNLNITNTKNRIRRIMFLAALTQSKKVKKSRNSNENYSQVPWV
jgi:hypothetical protein